MNCAGKQGTTDTAKDYRWVTCTSFNFSLPPYISDLISALFHVLIFRFLCRNICYARLSIVIALLIFLRAEGPKKFQQGNKILITPLYSCAENLSQISTFYDAYFRRKFHVTKIGNTIGLLCPT